MLQEQYPNRLCFFRKKRRMSQKQLAFRAGIKNRRLISHYERGRVEPSYEMAWKFGRILEAHHEDIFPQLVIRWQQEVDATSKPTPTSLNLKKMYDQHS